MGLRKETPGHMFPSGQGDCREESLEMGSTCKKSAFTSAGPREHSQLLAVPVQGSPPVAVVSTPHPDPEGSNTPQWALRGKSWMEGDA